MSVGIPVRLFNFIFLMIGFTLLIWTLRTLVRVRKLFRLYEGLTRDTVIRLDGIPREDQYVEAVSVDHFQQILDANAQHSKEEIPALHCPSHVDPSSIRMVEDGKGMYSITFRVSSTLPATCRVYLGFDRKTLHRYCAQMRQSKTRPASPQSPPSKKKKKKKRKKSKKRGEGGVRFPEGKSTCVYTCDVKVPSGQDMTLKTPPLPLEKLAAAFDRRSKDRYVAILRLIPDEDSKGSPVGDRDAKGDAKDRRSADGPMDGKGKVLAANINSSGFFEMTALRADASGRDITLLPRLAASIKTEQQLVWTGNHSHKLINLQNVFGEDDECLICLTDTRDTILLPCRHLCICRGCLSQLHTGKCPVCRGPIRGHISLVPADSPLAHSPHRQLVGPQSPFPAGPSSESAAGPRSEEPRARPQGIAL